VLTGLTVVAVAQDFICTTNNGTITISYYRGSDAAVVIPNTIGGMPVVGLGSAFFNNGNLTSVTIPNSLTNIGDYAFYECYFLTSVYFKGNAPTLGGSSVYYSAIHATNYYLPGTTGWGATFGSRPAVLWNPRVQTSGAGFGVRTNRFGFNLASTNNLVVVVEACTNLNSAIWQPVQTNTLTGGAAYFSDPQWTNFPRRFYRLAMP
jgi:BspA type Leucine rich repeat region (6 copies)